LLEFIGTYKRDRDSDLRNQFMHNLRGVTKDNALEYMLGIDVLQAKEDQKKNDEYQERLRLSKELPGDEVLMVYRNEVQTPFRQELYTTFSLSPKRTENLLEKALHDLADHLN
jgi:hypothetical protein